MRNRGGCFVVPAMRDFNDWISLHDLVDLPLQGAGFTWSNKQNEPVMSHLDRFLVYSVDGHVS